MELTGLTGCSQCRVLVSSPASSALPASSSCTGAAWQGFFFFHFFNLFLFFSGSLYSKSIAGIPGGLLLSREDALFSARSCSGEGLEEIHSATFLLGLLARALQSAAATGQAGRSEKKKGLNRSEHGCDLPDLCSLPSLLQICLLLRPEPPAKSVLLQSYDLTLQQALKPFPGTFPCCPVQHQHELFAFLTALSQPEPPGVSFCPHEKGSG